MEIQKIAFGPKTFLGVKELVTFEQMKDRVMYEEKFAKITKYLSDHFITPAGPPTNIYFTWDEEKQETMLGVAFPVEGVESVESEDVELMELPESQAVEALHEGDYENLHKTHKALWDYIEEHSLEWGDWALEEYLTDPTTETDGSKWQTNVVYAIESAE